MNCSLLLLLLLLLSGDLYDYFKYPLDTHRKDIFSELFSESSFITYKNSVLKFKITTQYQTVIFTLRIPFLITRIVMIFKTNCSELKQSVSEMSSNPPNQNKIITDKILIFKFSGNKAKCNFDLNPFRSPFYLNFK